MASNEHSVYYDLVKKKWEAHEWTLKMLRALVRAGRITAGEYEKITGKVWNNDEKF